MNITFHKVCINYISFFKKAYEMEKMKEKRNEEDLFSYPKRLKT